ncbi:ComEA family DNA-binding protein [Frondihabitans cladoniiphilus]|uniref:Helix-hairpin-helix DNA-binding motif class 1 domain-containing protein n=1 Tax=Frondihabitans cladoniiphilus TaxID=715785 RepID=A0ABP8VKM4_9MICO
MPSLRRTETPSVHHALPTLPTDFREPGSAPRWRVGVGAALVAVLVLMIVGVAVSALAGGRDSGSVVDPRGAGALSSAPIGRSTSAAGQSDPASSGSEAPASVFVHILGRVTYPGLYEVPPGSRAVDVVTAAGGLTDGADQARINLARPVSDGEQIEVPAVGEASLGSGGGAAGGAGAGAGSAGGAAAGGAAAAGGLVDLNTADAAALESLPGVGPSTAQAILDWRQEHGRFAAPEDLLDVTGIGDKKFEKLRDRVRAS